LSFLLVHYPHWHSKRLQHPLRLRSLRQHRRLSRHHILLWRKKLLLVRAFHEPLKAWRPKLRIKSGYSRTRPEIIKDMEEALKPIIADLNRQSEQMINASARLYAQRISEAELKEIAAFFKSASGQKYVNSQADVLNDLFTEMQVFSQTLGNVMMDRLREDLRKKNIQI
jgi:Uncharacterized protein conserved in bacteria (DUF2059)